MAHDYLFSEKRDEIRDFDFGKDTAVVFDDMLDRSVDGWATMLSRIPFSLGLSPALTLGYLVLLRLKRSKSLITNLLTLRTNNPALVIVLSGAAKLFLRGNQRSNMAAVAVAAA